MNKQEVIKELKSGKYRLADTKHEIEYNKGIGEAIHYIENCSIELEKPVVPQFVDTWIQGAKYNGFDLYEAMTDDEMSDKVATWIVCNSEIFAKAWFFGYEVEKEKLYTVELPNPNGGTHLVLCKDCDGKLFVETFLIDEWETFGKCKLTETEIKKEFSWTWQFAKELEDKDQEEKLYTVEFPNPNSDNHLLLRKNFDGKVCVSLLHSEYWRGNESTRLTEAEIKEGFDWAWQFAKEVEND